MTVKVTLTVTVMILVGVDIILYIMYSNEWPGEKQFAAQFTQNDGVQFLLKFSASLLLYDLYGENSNRVVSHEDP